MNIKLLLGIIPETKKYEESRDSLFEEYKRFTDFEKSEELKSYLELKEETESDDFKNKVTEIKAQKYQNTPEYQKEQEYISQTKSTPIKNFYKFKESGDPEWISSYEKSSVFKDITKLEKLIESEEFLKVKQKMSRPGKERYKETEAFNKLEAYNELKNDHQIKNYLKFIKHKGFEIFIKLHGSKEWKHFEELKEIVASQENQTEYKNLKKNTLLASKEWQQFEAYNTLKENSEFSQFKKISQKKETEIYLKTESSEILKQYRQLEKIITSTKYQKDKEKEGFEQTESYQKLIAFEELQKDPEIKTYFEFINGSDFELFNKYNGSKDWKEFTELENLIHSNEYKSSLKQIKEEAYKETDLYKQFEEYNKLKRESEIKLYNKLKDSEMVKDYLETEKSDKLKTYEELNKLVESAAFNEEKQQIEKSTFKDTKEYKQEQELLSHKKTPDYKRYTKLINSSVYRNYTELDESDTIKEYEKLKKYIESDKFLEVKGYMLLKPAEKYKRSEEFQKAEAYKEMANSDNIKWFYRVQKINKFKDIKILDPTFNDEFEEKKLDAKKWMTRYFWGDVLLKDSFSLAADKHFVTNGKNIELNNSVLSIVTKQEAVTGKAWDIVHGFYFKDYNFTSGLINTGNSFRQKYGLFEAKIKLNTAEPVSHAFWMISDKMLPHIDIVKYDKKLWMNNFWMNGSDHVHKNITTVKASKYTSDYFIYSLEWKKNMLKWRINGVTVATKTTGVPDEPMYINFSSALYNDKNVNNLPAVMDIDWVRCYQFTE